MPARYIPAIAYCPHCKRRHEACIPEEVVRERSEKSVERDPNHLYYVTGDRAQYKLSARYLPRIECDACCEQRIGKDAYERLKDCERLALHDGRRN